MFYMHASLFDINVYYMPKDANYERKKTVCSVSQHHINYTGFLPYLPHKYNKANSTQNLISTAVRHISCHRSTLKAGWFDSTDSATAMVRPALKNHTHLFNTTTQTTQIITLSYTLNHRCLFQFCASNYWRIFSEIQVPANYLAPSYERLAFHTPILETSSKICNGCKCTRMCMCKNLCCSHHHFLRTYLFVCTKAWGLWTSRGWFKNAISQ